MSETPEGGDDREVVARIEKAIAGSGLRRMSDDEFAVLMAEGRKAQEASEAADRAAGKVFLDEEKDRAIIDQWYADAHQVNNPDDLHTFVTRLITTYRHDYGTICHALAAAAIAAAYAVNGSPQGGITGFQAGAVMWQFIQEWNGERGEPMRLLKYRSLLYPQSIDEQTRISQDTWDWLQKEAQALLANNPKDSVHPRVWEHWVKIGQIGVVPLPFRLERS